jgi:integrase/recombinase XerD
LQIKFFAQRIMIKEKPTTAIYLDTRRAKKGDVYPVKLRITFKRKSKLYSTSFAFTEEDFEKVRGKSPRNQNKEDALELSAIEGQAADIIEHFSEFSFEKFEHAFLNRKSDLNNAIFYFKKQIAQYELNHQYGSASSFKSAMLSLIEYKGENILFTDITPKFMKDYEIWMLDNKKSITTISIYCRSLRKIFNTAMHNGDASMKDYPFGRAERALYSIPEARNIKKGLKMSDLKKIYNYESKPGTPEKYYKDLWIFSYLCSGLNMKDICLLKYKNIHGDNLQIVRAKTSERKRDRIPISIVLTDDTKLIIEKHGNKPKEPEKYIFPVLTDGMDLKKQYYSIKQLTKQVNKYIKRVAAYLKIESNLSSIYARHSYASTLKNAGVNIAFISEQMGHSSIKVTENYLSSFEDDARIEVVKKLTDF